MMKPTAEELLKEYITCLDSQFSWIDDHSSFAGEGAAQEQPKESFAPFIVSFTLFFFLLFLLLLLLLFRIYSS